MLGSSSALGNPYPTRVSTFPQQRRLLLSCPSKTPNPTKSRGPPDSRAEPKNQRVYCHLSGLLAIGNLKIPGLAIARHASFITAHPIVREFTWRTGAELAIGSY